MRQAVSDGRKRRRESAGEDGHQRVQLACFHCRSKRIRCSGTKPVCEVGHAGFVSDVQACLKAKESCEWPSGRRRKRTRKEMDEARRLEAALRPDIVKATSDEVGRAGRFVLICSPSRAGTMCCLTARPSICRRCLTPTRTGATTVQASSGLRALPLRTLQLCCLRHRSITRLNSLLVILYRE